MADKAVLDGLKVLDLSRILAGPWVSQTLADMGATVIKVERPGVGDDTRGFGPPFFKLEDGDELSAYFMSANRGKSSITLDIASEDGRDIILQLVQQADVLIENFKQGDLTKRGLGFEILAKINPKLIYCSITGFGQTGPYRHRPGYDFMIQGMAGLMSITGEPDEVGGGPQKVGVALADIMTGLYSTVAILGALQERNASGLGQHIDMALLDVVTATLANQASNYLVTGEVPVRLGNAHPNIVPYQTFATENGHLILAVANDSQFRNLCTCLDLVVLADDGNYRTNADRVKNRTELTALLQRAFSTKTSEAWMPLLEDKNVPYGPINTIDQVFENEQIKSRGVAIKIDEMPLIANPIKYSRSPMNYSKAPPKLGQDTAQVLIDEIGLSVDQIDALRARGII